MGLVMDRLKFESDSLDDGEKCSSIHAVQSLNTMWSIKLQGTGSAKN
jgi:hypothetical protein